MSDFLKDSVVTIFNETKEEINKNMEKLQKKNDKIHEKLDDRIEKLERDNESLKEKLCEAKKEIREIKREMEDAVIVARDAQRKSNYNEQYSRKNNIKVHGIPEERREDTLNIVCEKLYEVANIDLKESDIVAVHRIPGRKDVPKPILIKVRNSDVKARIMKRRKAVRQAGQDLRLSDDVTKLNSALIQRLNDHPNIDQSWYFNGSVYATESGGNGKRIQFDIHDDITEKLKKK